MAGRGQSITGLTDQQLQVFEDLASDYMVELLTQIANKHAAAMLDRAGLTAAADPLIPENEPPPTPPPTPADFAAIPSEVNAAIAQNIIPLVAQAYISGGGVIRSNLIDAGATGLPRVHSVDAEAYLRTAPIGYYDWIGADLLDQVRTGLADGLAAGDSIPELADRVKAAAGITSRQATLTARTSVIAANNSASIDVMAAAQIDGTEKEWLATNDLRTRASHLAADGQRVPLDGKFLLDDGSECEYPGEYTLPPAQRDNCRCTVGYVIPDRVIGPTGGAEAYYSGDSLARQYVQGDITHSELIDAVENPPALPGHLGGETHPAVPAPARAGKAAGAAGAPDAIPIRPGLEAATSTAAVEGVFEAQAQRITGRVVTADFRGSSLVTAREHAEGVLRVLERYPDAQLDSIVTHQLVGPFYAQAGNGLIEFNTTYASAAGRANYLFDLSRGTGEIAPGLGRWSVIGSGNPAATAIHEMGHILGLDTLGGTVNAEVERVVRDMAVREGLTVKQLVDREISIYGSTDTDELLAEAMTDVVLNGSGASELSREIMAVVDQAYKDEGHALVETLGRVKPKLAFDPLAGKTVPQLRTLARERGVTIPTGAKKDDIVALLRETEPAAAPAAVEALAPIAEPPAGLLVAKRGEAGLSAAQKSAIRRYTNNDAETAKVNGILRTGKPHTALIDRIDEAMASSVTTEPALVYRGLGEIPGLGREGGIAKALGLASGPLPDNLVGHEWTEAAFGSTTRRRGIAEVFGSGKDPVILEIRVPPGTHAIELPTGEEELLLDRGLTYRVTGDRIQTQMVGMRGDTPLRKRVLDVEIVPARADALVTATPAAAVDDLATMKVPQLRTLARERGVTIPTGAKKDDILRLLREAEAKPAVEVAPAVRIAVPRAGSTIGEVKLGPTQLQVALGETDVVKRPVGDFVDREYRGPDGVVLARGMPLPADFASDLASIRRGEFALRPGLTADESQALDRYALSRVADPLNNALRRGETADFGTVKIADQVVSLDRELAHLDAAIAAGQLGEDTQLYRGALMRPADVGKLQVGAITRESAFLSTTTEMHNAFQIINWREAGAPAGKSRVLFRILAPRGTSAAAGHIEEREVLLARGREMRVVDVSKPTRPGDVRTITLELLPDAKPVEAVVEENPLVTAARVRQAAIDEARAVADLTAKVFESLGAEVEPAVLRTQIEQTAARLKVPDKVRDALLKAVDTGDAKKIATAADRVAKNAGLTRVGTPETEVPFSHAEHQAVPGAQVRAGEAARIIRPGYTYQYGNEVVQISKAAVEEGLTRAETIANAKRLIERDASTAQLRTAGVKKVGTVSDRPVKYDPTKYELRGGGKVPAGAKVRVVEPGYTTVYRGQIVEVSKPVVEVIPEARSASAAPLKKIIKLPADQAQVEIAKAIDGEYAGGIRAEVTRVDKTMERLSTDGQPTAVMSVAGRLYSQAGDEMGTFERRFYNGPHGWEVEHEGLHIDPSYQGSGFASDFNANLYDWYRRSGIKRVTVYTEQVGGYAWATQGYDFVDAATRHQIFDSIGTIADRVADRGAFARGAIDDMGPLSDRDYRTLVRGNPFPRDAFMEQLPLLDALEARVANGEEVSAYELSQLGRKPGQGKDDWWIGKALMIGRGWDGLKLL